MDERFQERRDQIKVLGRRAHDAGIAAVRSHEDAVKLLLPHTAYKSYPESWLSGNRWDRLSKWLDTVSSHRVPVERVSEAADVDDWIDKLAAQGLFVSCSSGTTGKSAMLIASDTDLSAGAGKRPLPPIRWGSGVKPARDRRMFGMAAVAHVARNRVTGEAYIAALQDPAHERFAYPVPPITVGGLTKMVVLRKARSRRRARKPMAGRHYCGLRNSCQPPDQKAVDDAVGITARAVVEARRDKLHVTGLWAGLYTVAKAVRELGYDAKDFHPENSIYVGGGLKRAKLPDDIIREFVYQTFNIRTERNYQNYSMQELHSGMPRCRTGGRYHVPPWVIPLILDQAGDNLLPRVDGEYEGRAAFFDLSIDGRWGGVISGDRVSIDFGACACGAKSPSIRDNIVRYADLEGDDKIGCAGTVDAYVRGLS